MTARILDGESLASRFKAEIVDRVARLAAEGIQPGLGTILVGDDPPSERYVALKHADCAQVGIASIHVHLPKATSQEDLEAVIGRFNDDPAVHAYLVQLPLPSGLDEEAALLTMDDAKDVDGLHPISLGRLVMGAPGPLPCTPAGIVELLHAYDVPVEGRHVVVIGRGITIGRPLALLLALKRPGCNAAVTVVHTGVPDLGEHVRRADIVVAAAGSPGLVKPDMVKPGAAVVGAGATWEGRTLLSDVEESVAEVAGWITPRIGGVGPMTRTMLLRNAVYAAERSAEPASGSPPGAVEGVRRMPHRHTRGLRFFFVSQALGPEHIDLFDGPSWEQRDYWDDVPRTTSKLAVTVQVVLGILVNLMVPAAFALTLAALGWGLNQFLSFHVSS